MTKRNRQKKPFSIRLAPDIRAYLEWRAAADCDTIAMCIDRAVRRAMREDRDYHIAGGGKMIGGSDAT